MTGKTAWNKGLTKETSSSVNSFALKLLGRKGISRPIPEEMKKRISESMKKAHAEGRAHNIGKTRWNNEPSYPEKWFMKVIENEFQDKNYQREVPFHRYSLDFAWVDRKKVIEIDGEQHEREPWKSRDEKKNNLLKEDGWDLLRMPWKLVIKDTKVWIAKAVNFIEG